MLAHNRVAFLHKPHNGSRVLFSCPDRRSIVQFNSFVTRRPPVTQPLDWTTPRTTSLCCSLTFGEMPNVSTSHTAEQQQHVSTISEDATGSPEPLQRLCAELDSRITAFLREKSDTLLLEQVQKQTKKALEVVDQALSQYRSDLHVQKMQCCT